MKKYKQIYLLIFLFLFSIFLWVNFPSILEFAFHGKYANKNNLMSPNEFGDSFGVLNALFSGLAFAGLLYSIRLQGKELADSKSEMKSQGAEFLAQTKAMNRQAFDSAFFQLLNFNNDIAKGTDLALAHTFEESQDEMSSKDVFYSGSGRAAFKEMYRFLVDVMEYREFAYIPDQFMEMQETYMSFHNKVGEHLAHYFRNLYQVLKFIDDSSILNGYEKKKYSNMIRAQVSKYELVLLFYNCLSPLGFDKFKPLLEKYEFFEHLPSDVNIPIMFVGYYDVSAFGWTNKDYYFNHLRSKINDCRDRRNCILTVFNDNDTTPVEYTSDSLPSDSQMIVGIKTHKIIWLETRTSS
ncbi:putative phage abortive infection protein [Aeromonas enteropelogenes]|uniref:putative phage abortive infection protein n=1 Tax=Aeromonas enteropelogenes TaxID=29489 RepID=UPI0031359E3F